MNRALEWRPIWGIILIALGLLLLSQTMGIVPFAWGPLVAAAFALAGLAFLFAFAARPYDTWWAAIPALTLLALGTLIAFGTLGPRHVGAWGGTIFLGGIGLSFWLIYLARREFWWAIIPGGTLFTLAAIAGLADLVEGELVGSLFFGGIGLTFLILYLAPTPQGQMRWAIFPAIVCLALGLVVLAAASPFLNYLWPLLLIGLGLYLLLRGRGQGRET